MTGLVRNEEKARRLLDLGGTPLAGDLRDPANFEPSVADHDAVAHLALVRGKETDRTDGAAVDALLRACGRGRCRAFVYTSGVWVLGDTGDLSADEDAPTDRPAQIVAWRPAHERRVLDAGGGSCATAVLRPGVVFGGRGGLIGAMFESAVKEGASTFVGEGRNRWSIVPLDDLAALYLLLLEKRAQGVFHGVAEPALPVAEIARAASEAAGAGGRVRSLPLDAARRELGALADARVLDQVVVSRRSAALGWIPLRAPFPSGARAAFAEWKE